MNYFVLLFYLIASFFSGVSKKISLSNSNINSELIKNNPISGFIEKQSDYKAYKLGKKTMDFSGCGVIAVYNTLLSLRNLFDDVNILEIIKAFEKHGLTCGGSFGISPISIKHYLKRKGLNVISTSSGKESIINAIGNKCSVFVCTIYNKKGSIKNGLHHISVTKDTNGNYISHNPYTEGLSLFETIQKASNHKGSVLFITGVESCKNQ